MEVYRLTKSAFATDLSGEGARLYGGRWNRVGFSCLYVGSSRAICVLEFAVHVKGDDIPKNLSMTEIILPKCNILKLLPQSLPPNWTDVNISQKIGSQVLFENKYLLIQVPSVIIPDEYNFIINPNHPDFNQVHIKKTAIFELDERIKM